MQKVIAKMLKLAVMGASIWSSWDTERPAFVTRLKIIYFLEKEQQIKPNSSRRRE